MQRNREIDVARTLANFLIVLWHADAVRQYCIAGGVENGVWNYVEHLALSVMPALFFLSGYFMMQGWSLARHPGKIVNRVKRLALPYVAWNAVFVLCYLALASFVPRIALRADSFELYTFAGAFGKIAGALDNPIDLPLWYLRAVFVYALAFPLLAWLLKRAKGAPAFLFIAAYAIAQRCVPAMQSWGGYRYDAATLAFFTAGAWFNAYAGDPARVFAKGWIFAFTLALFTVRHFWGALLPHTPLFGIALELAMVPIVFWPAKKISQAAGRARWLDAAIEMSFWVYAAHFMFCSVLLHSAAPFCAGMESGKRTLLTLVFLAGVPAMAAAYRMLSRIAPRALALFSGRLAK